MYTLRSTGHIIVTGHIVVNGHIVVTGHIVAQAAVHIVNCAYSYVSQWAFKIIQLAYERAHYQMCIYIATLFFFTTVQL